MRICTDDIGKQAYVIRRNRIVSAKIKSILVEVLTEGGDELILDAKSLFARPESAPLKQPEDVPVSPQ